MTDRLLLDPKALREYPAEAALLSIACQAPDRIGEVMDAVDVDLWGCLEMAEALRHLAEHVQRHGIDGYGWDGWVMAALDDGVPLRAITFSELLDVAMSRQSVKPFARRIVSSARERLVRETIDRLDVAVSDGDDIGQHVAKLQEAGSIGQRSVLPMLEVMDESITRYSDGEEQGRRWSTGLPTLDDRLGGGLRAPQLVVIGGRPAMGKTALGLGLANAIATAGGRVHVYSGEMARDELAGRLWSLWSDVEQAELARPGHVPQRVLDRIVDDLGHVRRQGYRMNIDDRGSLGWSDIAAGVLRSAHRFGGLDAFVLDYLQLMPVEKGGSEYTTYTEASKRAKGLAKELGCVVILLCQLSRKVEDRPVKDRKPKPSDLRATGQIEQDADVILYPYRHVVYDKDAPLDGAEIGCPKFRQGPSGWWEPMRWNGPMTRFEDPGGIF